MTVFQPVGTGKEVAVPDHLKDETRKLHLSLRHTPLWQLRHTATPVLQGAWKSGLWLCGHVPSWNSEL